MQKMLCPGKPIVTLSENEAPDPRRERRIRRWTAMRNTIRAAWDRATRLNFDKIPDFAQRWDRVVKALHSVYILPGAVSINALENLLTRSKEAWKEVRSFCRWFGQNEYLALGQA